MYFITRGIFLLKCIISGLIPIELGCQHIILHWQNKKRLLQGVILVGLTLRLFYHMKMTFEKEMFLLIGVIDLC